MTDRWNKWQLETSFLKGNQYAGVSITATDEVFELYPSAGSPHMAIY